jgi:hypothetical protein
MPVPTVTIFMFFHSAPGKGFTPQFPMHRKQGGFSPFPKQIDLEIG